MENNKVDSFTEPIGILTEQSTELHLLIMKTNDMIENPTEANPNISLYEKYKSQLENRLEQVTNALEILTSTDDDVAIDATKRLNSKEGVKFQLVFEDGQTRTISQSDLDENWLEYTKYQETVKQIIIVKPDETETDIKKVVFHIVREDYSNIQLPGDGDNRKEVYSLYISEVDGKNRKDMDRGVLGDRIGGFNIPSDAENLIKRLSKLYDKHIVYHSGYKHH